MLLDLDGVLLDHEGAVRDGLRAWLGARATPAVERAWRAAQDRHLARWRAGELGWQEQRRERLRDVLPVLGEPVGTAEELDQRFAEGFLAGYERSWRAFPDAAPAIRALRAAGLRTGVLTNGSEEQQRAKLAAIGLLDLVGPVVTAGSIGVAKPDPRAFLIACDRLGVAPSATLHIGDEPVVDVLGARGAGLRAVLLDRDGAASDQEPCVVRGLQEVPLLVASGSTDPHFVRGSAGIGRHAAPEAPAAACREISADPRAARGGARPVPGGGRAEPRADRLSP